MKWLLLFAGGGIGTLFRYAVSGAAYKLFGVGFPWGTFSVNAIGAFIIGVLWSIADVSMLSPEQKVFILIGILGGFTTFSSFMLEFMNLIRTGEYVTAALYITITNVIGVIAVFSGFFLIRVVRG